MTYIICGILHIHLLCIVGTSNGGNRKKVWTQQGSVNIYLW